jgi:hypothetical protein
MTLEEFDAVIAKCKEMDYRLAAAYCCEFLTDLLGKRVMYTVKNSIVNLEFVSYIGGKFETDEVVFHIPFGTQMESYKYGELINDYVIQYKLKLLANI